MSNDGFGASSIESLGYITTGLVCASN